MKPSDLTKTWKGKSFKKGDLIQTWKGNLALVLDSQVVAGQRMVDLMFVNTGYVRTGFPAYKCKVLNEGR